MLALFVVFCYFYIQIFIWHTIFACLSFFIGELFMVKKFWSGLLGISMGLVMSFTVGAQGLVPPKEGVDFQYVNVGAHSVVQDSSRPVVVEFFWYGCPHCFRAKPIVAEFKRGNPNIDVIQFPVVFSGWESGAKIHFTLEMMGLSEEFHEKVYNEIHVNRGRILQNDADFFAFMQRNKADPGKVRTIHSSFTVATNVTRARNISRAYNLKGTPSFAVHRDGKVMLVEPSAVGGVQRAMDIIEALVK